MSKPILALVAALCLPSWAAHAAKRALVLSDENYIPGPTANVASALGSRGYQVTFKRESRQADIQAFIASVQSGDQVALFIGGHGYPVPGVGHAGEHFVCLNHDCTVKLTMQQLRELVIEPLQAKGVRPVLMQESCGSGSTVLSLRDVPGACVISSTEATSLSYSATDDFAAALRNPKTLNFDMAARELQRQRLVQSQLQPARGSSDIWRSGCADPDAMQVRTDLFSDAAWLGEWNVNNGGGEIFRALYPNATRSSSGSVDALLAASCSKDHGLVESLAVWENEVLSASDESMWEENFQAHSLRMRADLLAGGVYPGQESIQSWRDLKRELRGSVQRIRAQRDRMHRVLSALNSTLSEAWSLPDGGRPRIAELRAEYLRLEGQMWEQVRDFDVLFTWLREVRCMSAPNPCKNAAI